LIAVNCTSN